MNKEKVDTKALKKILDTYAMEEVETLEDGTIKTPRYETGIIGLDTLLNGGLPQGTPISIATEEGGGKTTIMIQCAGNIIEKYGKKVYYFDIEGGATPELISSMGYGEHLYHPINNPDGKFYRLRGVETIQEILKVTKLVLQDPDTGLVVIDSTTLTTDGRQLEDEYLGMNKNSVGSHARMWSEASRPLNVLIKNSTSAFVFIHQARENLSGFIVKTEGARGRALKHLTSAELFGRISKYLDADGNECKKSEAKGVTLILGTEKNRLTRPFVKVKLPVFFGKGVSNKWAYKEFLEEKETIDATTGEKTKMLTTNGGGYYTFTLPSGVYKVRGAQEVNSFIDTHIDEILDIIKNNGGITLDMEEEDLSDNE